MKNKVLTALLTAVIASVASADILFWQVNSDVTIEGDTTKVGSTWNYASLYAVDSTDAIVSSAPFTSYTWDSTGDISSGTTLIGKDAFDPSAYANIGNDYTGYSFYIELINVVGDTETGIARSEKIGASDLSNAIRSTADFNAGWSSINAMGSSSLTFTAIPEPTSGLMLLVGAAILGLRRKRQQI